MWSARHDADDVGLYLCEKAAVAMRVAIFADVFMSILLLMYLSVVFRVLVAHRFVGNSTLIGGFLILLLGITTLSLLGIECMDIMVDYPGQAYFPSDVYYGGIALAVGCRALIFGFSVFLLTAFVKFRDDKTIWFYGDESAQQPAGGLTTFNETTQISSQQPLPSVNLPAPGPVFQLPPSGVPIPPGTHPLKHEQVQAVQQGQSAPVQPQASQVVGLFAPISQRNHGE